MIKIENLSVYYGNNKALDEIDLELPDQGLIGIIGPNGAGKSTLIKALLKIVDIDEGSLLLNGEDIHKKLRQLAYVPQKTSIDLSFPITVEEVVMMGTYPNLKLFQRPKMQEKEIVEDCLKRLDINDLRHKQVGQLSGGQLQRVFIAKALASKADVFLLDEPFAGIDILSESIIIKILKKLRDQGKLILVVHHDLHAVEAYFDKVILLNKKVIAFGDVKTYFTQAHINQAYGGGFKIKEDHDYDTSTLSVY